MMKSDPFIYLKDNELSDEFCQHVIDKFESEPLERRRPGAVGYSRRYDYKMKKSYDLWLQSYIDDWKEEDDVFFEHLTSNLRCYTEYIKSINPVMHYYTSEDVVKDTGYQIQKYIKSEGGHYDWHHDFMVKKTLGARMLTYIWYLNDVKEGGHTEFMNGVKVEPKRGRLCIFPATWTYLHRGCVPISNDKYIVTGWVYCGNDFQKTQLV